VSALLPGLIALEETTMTTMTNPSKNGGRAARPPLSDQIDRLDRMLDGFADALNEAVADAVKASVGAAARQAVADAMKEALASHAAQGKAAPAQAGTAPAPKRRTLREALGAGLGWLCALGGPPAAAAGGALAWAWNGVLHGLRAAASGIASACCGAALLARMAWSRPGARTATATGGVGAGLMAWLGGHVASVAMCAVGGAALALSAALLLPLGMAASGEDA
jgi:hypothetical protein